MRTSGIRSLLRILLAASILQMTSSKPFQSVWLSSGITAREKVSISRSRDWEEIMPLAIDLQSLYVAQMESGRFYVDRTEFPCTSGPHRAL